MLWSIVSNAELRSNRTSTDTSPLSEAKRRSFSCCAYFSHIFSKTRTLHSYGPGPVWSHRKQALPSFCSHTTISNTFWLRYRMNGGGPVYNWTAFMCCYGWTLLPGCSFIDGGPSISSSSVWFASCKVTEDITAMMREQCWSRWKHHWPSTPQLIKAECSGLIERIVEHWTMCVYICVYVCSTIQLQHVPLDCC